MDLNHLHLHVRDVDRAKGFYERLGFRERVRHGDILFMRNERGFDLALAPESERSALPSWFHFGFRLETGDAVRAVYETMRSQGVAIVKTLYEDPELVSFRCADPDGYGIEIFWE